MATPNEASHVLVPELLALIKVIDLSGSIRLKENTSIRWYGFEHRFRTAQSAYGLTEIHRDGIRTAHLVANRAAIRPLRFSR